MNQRVKHFYGRDDDRVAKEIEDYAAEWNLHIDSIAYGVGARYGHALVVFSHQAA